MNTNQALRYTVLLGVFLIPFIPFIVAYSQFFPFITGKGFTFRVGVEIITAIWLVLFFADKSFRPKMSWILYSILIFVGVIAVADFAGQYPYKSIWSNYERMEGLVSLVHLLLYFLVSVSMLQTEKIWNRFFNTSIVASVLMCFYGILQLAHVATINQGGVRVDGTFGNATYLAIYLVFHVFLSTLFLLRYRGENWLIRPAYGIALILQLVILYYTATRGAILGLIGGVIIAAITIAIFEKERKMLRRGAIGAIVAVLVCIGAFFALKNTDFVLHSPVLSRFATLSSAEIKSQGRYYVWPMAIKGFKERPILGWGQENFNYVFNKYYNPSMYNQEPWFDRTHNIMLDWLIAGGILGLLAYISLFVVLIWYLWTDKENFSAADKGIITGLMAAYVFHNMFVFDNLISYITFFSVLAYVHFVVSKNKTEPGWMVKITKDENISKFIVPSITVVVAIFAIYMVNVKPILANRTLIKAIDPSYSRTPADSLENYKKAISYNSFGSPEAREQLYVNLPTLIAPTTDEITRSSFVTFFKSEYQTQVERTPQDARYLLFYGSGLSRVGDYVGGIKYLQLAHEASPAKQSILFELGSAYLASGDVKKSVQALKTALDLAPQNDDAKIIYAIALIYDRNEKTASEFLSMIKDQKVLVFDDRLISAYAAIGNYQQVLKILTTRVSYDPNNIQSHFSLAVAYLKTGQRQKSIEELRKAAEIDPKVKSQTDYYISEIQAGKDPTGQ